MSFLSYSANYQGILDIFLRDPERYLPFTKLLSEIMNGESELSRSQREMIALHVSNLNDCHYCVGSHRAVLEHSGIDDATITEILTGTASDPRMAAVLAFATTLTQSPGKVSQDDVNALNAVGLSDQSVEDIVGVVSLFSFLNRLVDGFGVKGSAEGFVQAGGMVAEHGYNPVVQMVQEKATR